MSNVTYLPWVKTQDEQATGSPEVSGEPVVQVEINGDSLDQESVASLSLDELEVMLVRKLHRHDMSLTEVQAWLAERDAAEGDAEQLTEKFLRLGYINDERLARELVARLGERKQKSRTVISRELTVRKLPSAVIAMALAEVSDESELEKATELAQSRARQLSGLDREVATRRLLGFLARRGYSGTTAMTAVRTALKLMGHE